MTTIELMPIQAFFDDRHLVERGLSNYWGYNTIGFFAPAPRYLMPGNDIAEFKHMVQRMHEAGIEVILDVVYNHTAEGNQLGPTLSFRGLDNASYYVLADDPRYYFDTTGCGNTVNTRHPRVVQMVMDSLALLGRGLPRRRLPLRPRGVADPRPRRRRLQQPVPRRRHPGPGARQGQDDLRELGPREVGLPGRKLPARLGRVERPLPRPRPRLRQGRRRHRRRLRPQLPRLGRHLRPARPAAMGEHQLHHRARRLHAGRPLRLEREAQRGERRGQPRRPRRQPLVELRRRGSDRRSRRSSPCATGCAASRCRRSSSARACR